MEKPKSIDCLGASSPPPPRPQVKSPRADEVRASCRTDEALRNAARQSQRPVHGAQGSSNKTRLSGAAMLNQSTISQITAKIAAKEISAREVMQACLDRMKHVEHDIHAFISYDAPDALAQARCHR